MGAAAATVGVALRRVSRSTRCSRSDSDKGKGTAAAVDFTVRVRRLARLTPVRAVRTAERSSTARTGRSTLHDVRAAGTGAAPRQRTRSLLAAVGMISRETLGVGVGVGESESAGHSRRFAHKVLCLVTFTHHQLDRQSRVRVLPPHKPFWRLQATCTFFDTTREVEVLHLPRAQFHKGRDGETRVTETERLQQHTNPRARARAHTHTHHRTLSLARAPLPTASPPCSYLPPRSLETFCK